MMWPWMIPPASTSFVISSLMLRELPVSQNTEVLMIAIDHLYDSQDYEYMLQKANKGKMNASEYWCQFLHATGRLLSYLQAIKVLVNTHKRWPELFDDFEVCSVPSSVPGLFPLRENKKNQRTIKSIVGRMTSDAEIIKKFQSHAQKMEKFHLDDIIQEQTRTGNIRPIVHAEVLLLYSIEKDGGTQSLRFFNAYRYIGCSKPTCRLCHYYFSAHASGVEVRPTHRNLYLSWRLPAEDQDTDPDAEKQRGIIMDKMLVKIREDTFRTLAEKSPETKTHDSNTEPTYAVDII